MLLKLNIESLKVKISIYWISVKFEDKFNVIETKSSIYSVGLLNVNVNLMLLKLNIENLKVKISFYWI